MRLSTDRRPVGLLAAALVALAGCDGKPKDGGGGTETTGTGGGRGDRAAVATAGPTPRQAADAFLKDLGEGNVTPDRVTTSFARKVGRPFPKGAEGGPGYSPPEVHAWLGQFNGATFTVGKETKAGEAIVLRGLAQFPDKSAGAFTLRVVKDGKAYKIDWVHRSGRQASEVETPVDPDLAAAQDTVRNFLDLLLGGDLKQARSLMAPAWRTRLSPPAPSDVREGYDFGPGFLDAKLRSWRGENFVDYTLPAGEFGPNKDAATFVAGMQAGGQKVPYVVKAARDPVTGEWLVNDFDRQ
jgi:hypothetical protein